VPPDACAYVLAQDYFLCSVGREQGKLTLAANDYVGLLYSAPSPWRQIISRQAQAHNRDQG
jgi:hypothetical protein